MSRGRAIPETAAHAAVWLAWPYREWGPYLADAQAELASFARAIATRGGEKVYMLVASPALRAEAEAALDGAEVELVALCYGDIWMRDVAPIFVRAEDGGLVSAAFSWNGWGGRYVYEEDAGVAAAIAAGVDAPLTTSSLFGEGGAVEVDGAGSCLTTRDCLLNENRNPGATESDVSRELERLLGVSNLLWLDGALMNDHTDGHVDTLARFVAEGAVVCMEPDDDDPNRDTLLAVRASLASMRDAAGRRLEVTTMPSPGRVENDDAMVMPASYANFYIANDAVFVPTYGVPNDDRAVEAIGKLFPTRQAIGVGARAILTGGGALHCVTREVPAPGPEEQR